MNLPKPYYQDEWVTQYCSDALTVLSELDNGSIDLLCTDPPYGISFMGKEWDKALPDKKVWAECLRILKPGSFAFVMSIPRADCLSRMIISLEDAGFMVNFTPIFWTYASGFPKAQNIGKAVDKRLGAEREVIGKGSAGLGKNIPAHEGGFKPEYNLTISATPQAKALDGSYGGFQPKPAVEVIIVAMKPLSEKTFVDQALKNGKGITWLDDCRIPYENSGNVATNPQARISKGCKIEHGKKIFGGEGGEFRDTPTDIDKGGRFPANLLVSDDCLNDGREIKGGGQHAGQRLTIFRGNAGEIPPHNPMDSGSFSRYFDLDKWWAKTFPFLIVPKASKSEKNKGLGDIEPIQTNDGRNKLPDNAFQRGKTYRTNSHPTVKPLKLMSYLITLGSRVGDIVLDPFSGSGTTALASKLLGRKCIGIEIEEKYYEIAARRCSQSVMNLSI